MNHGLATLGERLVIFAQAAIPSEPREGAFDDPAFGQHDKSRQIVVAFDDLQNPSTQSAGPLDQLTDIAPVGPDQTQAWKQTTKFSQHELGTVAVLDIGSVHHHRQHQAQRIYDNMTFASLDLLPAAKTLVTKSPPKIVTLAIRISSLTAPSIFSRPHNPRRMADDRPAVLNSEARQGGYSHPEKLLATGCRLPAVTQAPTCNRND